VFTQFEEGVDNYNTRPVHKTTQGVSNYILSIDGQWTNLAKRKTGENKEKIHTGIEIK
jgi:hypothetical protein